MTSAQDYAILHDKIDRFQRSDRGPGKKKGGTTLGVDWTVRKILSWTRGYFKDGGILKPRLEAEILLAHVLDVERLHLYLSPDRPLTVDERTRFREIIKERRAQVPLQHLIGEVTFLGLRFRVGKEALIPRPESEELLEKALDLALRDREISCLDLGTGSGVLAVCLARYLPLARVTAVDLSREALSLARENAELNNVFNRIDFLESDWFNQVEGTFDLIVSNPPYIAVEELASLPVEIREHEPRVALDGGRNGVERIEALTRRAREHMRPGASLLLEIGNGQGESVVERMREGGLVEAKVERDLAGKERFVIAQCP